MMQKNKEIADAYDEHIEHEGIEEMESFMVARENQHTKDRILKENRQSEDTNLLLEEAIDALPILDAEIKILQAKQKQYKSLILSSIEPSETHDGKTTQVFIKPGALRFSHYSDTKTILSTIVESDVAVLDCITFNRTIINQHIKDGRLPSTISLLEVKNQISPTLVFSPLQE